MDRIGVLNRIILILMGVLLAAVLAGLAVNEWQWAHWKPSFTRNRTSHMARTAAIIDIVLRARPDEVTTILRAVSSDFVHADIVAKVSEPDDLLPAPRVADKVRSLMTMPAPGLVAYTDGVKHGLAYPNAHLEGVIRRAELPLSPGRYLVVAFIVYPQPYSLDILGLPSLVWIGCLAVLLATLTLLAGLRAARPLRRLTEAVSRFDGRAPQAITEDGTASEMRSLIRAVGDMQKRVTSLLRERSFLIGAISHDAKTYLTRLRLRSEGLDDPKWRAGMISDVDAMSDLLDTSLAYARGTTITDRSRRVDLADLVATDLAEREATGTAIDVRGAFAEAAFVDADPVALRRVIANLVDNAVKFGIRTVQVSVQAAAGECSLVVDDDGPGIPAEEREKVFSPFYRLEKSRSRATGGTGLGLAIARQIVESLDGTIEIDAAPTGGARVVVRLPAASGRRPPLPETAAERYRDE